MKMQTSVLSEGQIPVDAIVPLHVDITDPAGEAAEQCGWYAAEGGKLALTLDVAPNDRTGNWNVKVQELASGIHASHTFLVK